MYTYLASNMFQFRYYALGSTLDYTIAKMLHENIRRHKKND